MIIIMLLNVWDFSPGIITLPFKINGMAPPPLSCQAPSSKINIPALNALRKNGYLPRLFWASARGTSPHWFLSLRAAGRGRLCQSWTLALILYRCTFQRHSYFHWEQRPVDGRLSPLKKPLIIKCPSLRRQNKDEGSRLDSQNYLEAGRFTGVPMLPLPANPTSLLLLALCHLFLWETLLQQECLRI